MTENNDGADKTQPKTDARVRPAVKSEKVEDLRTIEDRIITLAGPHLSEGGALARMYADRSYNREVYDFVSTVKDVAQIIQEEQRMKADPAYAEVVFAEARRNTEAMKRKR